MAVHRNQPVRVLHIAHSLGLGGTEKVLQLLVGHLDRKRFEPVVFAFESGPRAKLVRASGVDTHVGGDLLRLIKRLAPEIIHLHRAGWPEPGLLRTVRLGAAALVPRPVILETNVFGRHDPKAAILDATLFVSRFCADRFAGETGTPADPPRYRVLYNPVDTDFFTANTNPDRDLSRPVAGRVSRADPGKWSALALDILPLLAERVPGFRYRVIGGTDQAREYVRDHGLDQGVEFLDPVSTDAELAAFYDSLSVLAHANDTGESFGLVIAEAMACGLPVVTHPARGKRDNAQLELVEHGRTGFVAGTTEDYARAVAWCFEHPDEARAMGRAGQDKAARLYRAQTVARQLEAIYDDLLASRTTEEPA